MRDLRGILEAVRAIARASQRDAAAPVVFAEVCRVVCEGFGFDRSSVARYHEAARELEMVALYGDDSGGVPARLPLEAAPMMAQALESGELLYIADVRSTAAIPADVVESYGVTSIFVVPLISGGECIGFLSADRRGSPFALDELEVDTLETVAVIAATLLEKVMLAEESRRLAGLKDQFISLASHELRTPLAAAYGAIET
ncbi:MAG: GAF domain-containing protein, partial [Bryobacteraceae bacterium]